MTKVLHIVPLEDLREHVPSPDCWCKPTLDDYSGIYNHHSMDGREDFETGKRKLS